MGELDLSTAPTLRAELAEHIDAGQLQLIIDLTDVGFMDSTGLGMLVSMLKRAKEGGGTLTLAGPQRPVRRVLQITGLEGVFPIVDSVKDATGA